jgi:hypothetical protein
MGDKRLTGELAARVLGWRLAPGRYIKFGGWLPRWRFQPLSNIEDAFQFAQLMRGQPRLKDNQGRRIRRAGQVGPALGARLDTVRGNQVHCSHRPG